MRTIKFRGKSHNGEWVYGYLYELPSDSGNVCMILTTDNIHEDNSIKPQYHLAFTLWKDLFVVDSSTIGQFTGLLDKNGKEIYEGDILEFAEEMYAKVVWNKENARFEYQYFPYITVANTFYEFNMPYLLIVGNIHDNPELLKGGEQ